MLPENSYNVNDYGWNWQQPRNEDAAKDFNRHYHVVGAPVEILTNLVSAPTLKGDIWSSGNFQFKYDETKTKVTQFRVLPNDKAIDNPETAWEIKDYRVNEGSYSNYSDIYTMDANPMSAVIRPQRRFNREEWVGSWIRPAMLFDLFHNYKIVGASRKDIRALLGPSTFNEQTLDSGARGEYLLSRTKDSAPFNKFDWYYLDHPTCTGFNHSLNLELIYNNDKVSAWRLIEGQFEWKLEPFFVGTYGCSSNEGGPVPPLN